MDENKIKITIEPVKVETDPAVHVFQIEVDHPSGSWQETALTPGEAKMFLKGMQAGHFYGSGTHSLEVPAVPNIENL